jgi:hypothetical protein
VTRTRTSSEVKWVANELAALAGELERLDEQIALMTEKRLQLLHVRGSLETVGTALGAPALCAAVGTVRAHRAYGGRGYLVDWLKRALQAAGADGTDTISLSRQAEEQLGLSLPTEKDRQRFRDNSLVRALRKLAKKGLVERLPGRHTGPGRGGAWRWKPAAAGAELLAATSREV